MIFYLKICLILLLILPLKGETASFLSFSTGELTSEVASFDQNSKEVATSIKGMGTTVQFGYFLTNPMSVELSYTQIKNEDIEGKVLSPGAGSYIIESESEVFTYGLRWFIWEFLNIRLGASKKSLKTKIHQTDVNLSYDTTRQEENGPYYGIGLGMTFSKMQVYYDYTLFPVVGGEAMKLSEVGFRTFF